MKKGHKRLLILELVVAIILIINIFFMNILYGYKLILFLLGLTLLFWKRFGFEKPRIRFLENNLLEIIIFIFSFFILYYMFGLFIGFAKNGNYYTWNGLIHFIIPAIIYLILREFLRYNVLCKAEDNNITIVMSVVLFILLDISNATFYSLDGNGYKMISYIGLSLLPAITSNISYSYITTKSGYVPLMFYGIIMEGYKYLFPIIPNANIYLSSVISFLLPVLLWVRLNSFYEKEEEEELDRYYNKTNISILVAPAIIIAIMVYFYSGYFRYYAIAIASGSMSPKIKRGDVVIIDQKIKDYKKIEVGEVIAYKKENYIIVHRVVKKLDSNGKTVFYTKGDANKEMDSIVIEENMIIGVVPMKLSYLGLPTVWLNNL